MPKIIQYPFAFDENNNLVFIKDTIQGEMNHVYHCPECGNPMSRRMGEHNAWHFYHAGNQKCGIESYLHRIAKIILAEKLNNKQGRFVVILDAARECIKAKDCLHEKFNCHCQPKHVEYDLNQYYDLPVEIESDVLEPDNETLFRPDVLLRSSDPRRHEIFIEVFHKHQSSSKKIGSQRRIIEIRIRQFSDLVILKDQECLVEGSDIHFYNFNLGISPENVLKIQQDYARECGIELPLGAFPPCLSDYETFEKYGRCPKCGGMLVERSGRYGRIMACRNYPECKYTGKIEAIKGK